DRVVARAARDDVGAAAAIDGVVAGAAGQDIDAGRACDRDRLRGVERRSVDILEIGDDGRVAAGLVGAVGQIDIGLRQHHQGVVVGAAIDAGFGAAIGDQVVAGAPADDIGTAAAVDGIVARAAGQ